MGAAIAGLNGTTIRVHACELIIAPFTRSTSTS
jgi:hypothetical protein